MCPELSRIGYHAELIRYGGRASPDMQNIPFNNHDAVDPPLVKENGVTRILIYPGSFNPPHEAHLRLLNHAFTRSGHDFEFTAAIIVTTRDHHLESKMRRKGSNGLVLGQHRREALWQQAIKDNDRYWVFDGGDQVKWSKFAPKLRSALTARNTKVEFVALMGPDVVEARPDHKGWMCDHIITSDLCRTASFAGLAKPVQLYNCSEWHHPVVHAMVRRADVKEYSREHVQDQDPEGIFIFLFSTIQPH